MSHSQAIKRSAEKSTHFWCGLEYTFSNPSFATDSDGMILVDFLHELVLRHSLGGVVYMPSLVLEGSDGLRTDILKEEEPEIFIVHGMKDFWFTDVHGSASPLKSIVKSGGLGGDGNGYRRGRRSGGHCYTPWLRHFEWMDV